MTDKKQTLLTCCLLSLIKLSQYNFMQHLLLISFHWSRRFYFSYYGLCCWHLSLRFDYDYLPFHYTWQVCPWMQFITRTTIEWFHPHPIYGGLIPGVLAFKWALYVYVIYCWYSNLGPSDFVKAGRLVLHHCGNQQPLVIYCNNTKNRYP